MQVGELTSAHCGQTFTLQAPAGWSPVDPQPIFTDVLFRVRHDDATPYRPRRTLISMGGFSGTLDPTHPITLETGA